VIDPGHEAQHILKTLQKVSVLVEQKSSKKMQLKALLHTHAHLDHIGATREVSDVYPTALIALQKADLELYRRLKSQGEMFGIRYLDPVEPTWFLEDEEEFRVGEVQWKVIHHPGHSPGSVTFLCHQNTELGSREVAFTGDTLFQGSVGRTDLWGADERAMFAGIKKRLLTLDEDTVVAPGHGPESTIGIEKRTNPYL
jgi:glyoxylase-like metal-dependent hydrolase (beta-lactamase superfamily II)